MTFHPLPQQNGRSGGAWRVSIGRAAVRGVVLRVLVWERAGAVASPPPSPMCASCGDERRVPERWASASGTAGDGGWKRDGCGMAGRVVRAGGYGGGIKGGRQRVGQPLLVEGYVSHAGGLHPGPTPSAVQRYPLSGSRQAGKEW